MYNYVTVDMHALARSLTIFTLLIYDALSLTRTTFKFGIFSSALAFYHFIPIYPIEAVPVGTSIQPVRSTMSNWVIGGIGAITFLLMNCVNLAPPAQGERFHHSYNPLNF